MAIVNKFNVNKQEVLLDPDIIENMSANDVSYNSSLQYDENTVGDKLSELESEIGEFIRTKEKITTATASSEYTSVPLSKSIRKGQTIKGISGYTGKVLVLSDIDATRFIVINNRLPYVAEFDIEYIK